MECFLALFNLILFFNFFKMGSHTMVNLDIKRPMDYRRPRNPCISFSVLGGGISYMALIFDLTSIPLRLTTYPNNFSKVTPNAHYCGFRHMLYLINLIKVFQRVKTWFALSLDFITMSSTNTSISLCIKSCNRVLAVLWYVAHHFFQSE